MNNHQNEHCPKSFLGIENSRIQSQEQKYTCPSCSEEASLNTIGCEGCDEWYHYNCVGLTRADINKLDPNSPFICVSCNENDLYDPNSDNTIHPISASTEESSTPIILCPDQNDQVLQNQLSQPAPSSQPSITPLQSSDQPTPSVCELSKDTPLTRPKSSSRSKNNKTVENRTYTLELEKRIREQEKTINLLQKREKLIGGGETQNTFTKDQQPCQCAKPTYFQQSQTPLDYQYLNLQRQIEIQALESRLKATSKPNSNASLLHANANVFPPPPFQHGMQPPPYQPVFHHRHPSPTWHVPPTNFEPVYQQNTMGYTQPVPMNPSPFRTSKLQQNTNSSGTTNNHQLNNANHHRNNFYSGINNVRSQYTDTSRTQLESTITPQPSRLTTTESPCGNNQNNVQNVKDQSAWIFQAKLTSTDSDNQAKPVINSHEVNETFKQGSVQSAWEVQTKLTEAQINHHTQPSTGSKIN
ncbi:TAF3 [Mytilus edulis]|uniref:TAF3 n=1 Tax=Mytilus edulis TaxID=6550 RepID=A0A8S3QTY4_MYTED|nr:TAF3 [Mytilus edulis]